MPTKAMERFIESERRRSRKKKDPGNSFCVVKMRLGNRRMPITPFGKAGDRVLAELGQRPSLGDVTRVARAHGFKVAFRKVSGLQTMVCYTRK